MDFANLIKLAEGEGIMCLLFVCMLIYTLKTSKEREERLMSTLEKLSLEIKEDVKEIKSKIK